MRLLHRFRHGWSLIEVLTATTLGGIILGLAVVLAHGFFRLEENLRSERQTWGSLNRLAEQFREDAHAATAVALFEPKSRPPQAEADGKVERGAAWTFRLAGDRQVEYAVSSQGVTRIERVAGKVLGRERYALPAGTTARLEPPAPHGALVALRIAPEEVADRQPGAQPMRIVALVGFDHRCARQGGSP